MTRQLATIRKITEIKEHTNSDNLELAIIDGWQVVVRKGEFQQDQPIVYFEIDSFIPHNLAPFLSKGKEPREYMGIKGERLRSVKLRGEISQGLVMSLEQIITAIDSCWPPGETDITDFLNINKWERPVSPQMQGQARGTFPTFIRKTDQERVQNVFHKLTDEQKGDLYEVTLKLDGSSMTMYVKDGEVGVCSRNMDLKINEENSGNLFVKKFIELGMEEKLKDFYALHGRNIAIQGEIWGPGINGNWQRVDDVRFNVFDIFDIDTQKYLCTWERYIITGNFGLDHTLVFDPKKLIGDSVESLLDGVKSIPSFNNPICEGIVLKSYRNPDFSFKVINNDYLLKGGE